MRLAGSSSRRSGSGSGWRTANAIGAVEGRLRSYSLLDAETLFLINHTVRLSGMTLSQGKGGPAGRALRSEAIAAPPILSAKTLTTRLSLAALRINASKVVVAAWA